MEGAAAAKLAEARQRALELIQRYDELDDGNNGDGGTGGGGAAAPAHLYNKRAEAVKDFGERVEEGFAGASPGFSVLNVRGGALHKQMDKETFRSLKRFVEGKAQMPAAKHLRAAERRERLRQEREAKEVLGPRAPEHQKDFVKHNKEQAGNTPRLRNIKPPSLDLSKLGKGAEAEKGQRNDLSSPRNSPPSVLGAGHLTQVAWKGIPEQLQRMYYREVRAPEPMPATQSPVLLIEDASASHQEDAASPESPPSPSPGRAQSPLDPAEAARRERAKALEIAKAATTDLERRALQHARRKSRSARGKRATASARRPHSNPASEAGQDSGRFKALQYRDMCRQAREQVLAERKALLAEMKQRRDAAHVIQRFLRRRLLKLQNKQMIDLEIASEVRKKNLTAARLQRVFRGYKTRKVVTRLLMEQNNAAKKVQRLVRNSYNWKRLLKERLQNQQRAKEVQSQTDQEHYAWIQRAMNRAKQEENFRRVSTLGPAADAVRDWIIYAAKVTDAEDDRKKKKNKEKEKDKEEKSREKRQAPRALEIVSVDNTVYEDDEEDDEEDGDEDDEEDGGEGEEQSDTPKVTAKEEDLGRAARRSAAASQQVPLMPDAVGGAGQLPALEGGRTRQRRPRSSSMLRGMPRLSLDMLETLPGLGAAAGESRGAGARARAPRRATASSGTANLEMQPAQTRHWDSHRHQSLLDRRTAGAVKPDEFEAMNHQISDQLSRRVDTVHERVQHLHATLKDIATAGDRLPALHFMARPEAG